MSIVLAAVTLLAANRVVAVPVSPLTYDSFVVYHSNVSGSVTDYSKTPGVLSYGGAQTSSSLTPAPVLQATANAIGDGFGITSSSGATLYYSFVIGGPAGINVPVLVDAFGSVEVTRNPGSSAPWGVDVKFEVQQPGAANPTLSQTLRLDPHSPSQTSDSFRILDTYQFQSNVEYGVYMLAQANVSAVKIGDFASARAFVDPVFTIGGPNAHLFNLTFSDGIGNARPATAVPETGTSAVMLFLGMGGVLGLRIRAERARRKRVV